MREFRPHVVTTYDEDGGYPHPDHIMCHKVSVAAFDAAGDPDRYPELGEPWQPLKLYYHIGFLRPGSSRCTRRCSRRPRLAVRGVARPVGRPPDKGHRITTRVACADYFEVRDDALRAHATQVDPDGGWFRAPLDVQRRLADGRLRAGPLPRRPPVPEADLFAGVRESVCALSAGRTRGVPDGVTACLPLPTARGEQLR